MFEANRRKEEARIKPLLELGEKLDQLIDITINSTDFMVKANEIQTDISKDLKGSGDAASRHSKKNIILTYVVIGMALIGLLIPVYTSYRDNISSITQQEVIGGYAEQLSGKLGEIIGSVSEGSSKTTESLESINKNLLGQANFQAELKDKLKEQQEKITALREANEIQQNRIIKLEKELKTRLEPPPLCQGSCHILKKVS